MLGKVVFESGTEQRVGTQEILEHFIIADQSITKEKLFMHYIIMMS